jgi:hypothetical protein
MRAINHLISFPLGLSLEGSAVVRLLVGALTSMIAAFDWVAGTILFLNLDYRKHAAVEETTLPQVGT